MGLNIQYLFALFVLLFVMLALNPKRVNNIYNSLFGRLILVCVVVFFAMNNVTLGLLIALTIISATNQFGLFNLREGMDTIEPPITVGEDNTLVEGKQKVLTQDTSNAPDAPNAKKRISDLKANISNPNDIMQPEGIDKQDIENSIMSKDSNSIPVTTNSSEDVSAHKPSMLNSSSSLTEGFCPFAGHV